MSENELLKYLTELDRAMNLYKKRKNPRELLALIYLNPVYEADLVPGIVEYFEKKFDELKKEYKSMP